jgi:hypothetical protein
VKVINTSLLSPLSNHKANKNVSIYVLNHSGKIAGEFRCLHEIDLGTVVKVAFTRISKTAVYKDIEKVINVFERSDLGSDNEYLQCP